MNEAPKINWTCLLSHKQDADPRNPDAWRVSTVEGRQTVHVSMEGVAVNGRMIHRFYGETVDDALDRADEYLSEHHGLVLAATDDVTFVVAFPEAAVAGTAGDDPPPPADVTEPPATETDPPAPAEEEPTKEAPTKKPARGAKGKS